jgi:F-type H+-transporting ATPase subunit delta
MLTHPAAKEYARALLELAAEQNSVDTVQEQLMAVVQACHDNDSLGKIFYHPQVPVWTKRDAVLKLFNPVVADFVGKFLLLLIDKRREPLLPFISEEYERLADKGRNICKVEVTTALPLDESQKQSLLVKLNRLTGSNVELQTTIDKRLIGGAVLKIGDRRVDGSVFSHLEQLKTVLLTQEATEIGVTS